MPQKPDSLLAARFKASPNFGERRGAGPPDMILLHYTGMTSEAAALKRLCDPAAEVSAHYVIREDGEIIQLVRESMRAWHAGAGQWAGETDINSASIGIEIANPGHPGGLPDFPGAQIKSVIALCRDVSRRHHIMPARVLAHSDTAPGRKIDPGEKFPWDVLARNGAGHYVVPAPLKKRGRGLQPGDESAAVRLWQSMLGAYGYGIEETGAFDRQTQTVTEAFQRHFRPAKIDGIADHSTIATLDRLLKSLAPPAG